MKLLLHFLLVIFLAFWPGPGMAQFMSKKESSQIDNLLKELSEQHKPGTYLFKNVSLVSMADPQITEQDVLIEYGLIKEIGKNISHREAMKIEGKNKYLLPGLTDMHLHLFDNHQMKNTWMLLLLLNGVTSVRDMAGEPGKLVLRDKIRNNEILGPNIYQAGPIINGVGQQPALVVAPTPEEGRKHVMAQKQLGYDFIKIYNDLNRETYFAILDEAESQNIPVTGHLPTGIIIEEALNKQSSIEHLTGYKGWKKQVEAYLVAEEGYATITATSDTWNCPTLYNLLINWDREMSQKVLADRDISSMLPKKLIKRWEALMAKNAQQKEELLSKYGTGNQKLFKQIVQELYHSNAKLVAGTDAGSIPLLVPGYSLHGELAALYSIGIPIYEILKMATINAAMAMGKTKEFGTIEVGKRADLLLLDKDPMVDIRNLRHNSGVMVRGIWLSIQDLETLKQQLQSIYGQD